MFLSRRTNRRSNISFNHAKATDLSVGTITPAAMIDVSGGDICSFQPRSYVQAFAMKAPLLNGFKLCLEYFFAPYRLYHRQLLLDEMGVTATPDRVVFPTIQPSDPYKSTHFGLNGAYYNMDISDSASADTLKDFVELSKIMVQPGSFASYMGFPIGWFPTEERLKTSAGVVRTPDLESDENDRHFINVTKAVAMLDILYHYYFNQQYDTVYTSNYRTSYSSTEFGPTEPHMRFPYEQVTTTLEKVRQFLVLLKTHENPSEAIREWINSEGSEDADVLMSWKWLCSPNSLFQRSLPPYYLEQWLKTTFVDSVDDTVKIDVQNESIAFADVRTKSHIQRFVELAMAGGSRYSDFENAEFDTARVKNSTTPIFLGMDRLNLGSNIIYQTTGFDNASSPLGSFAGQMAGGNRHRKRTFKFSEQGIFFVFATLVPDTIYYRGLDESVRRIRLDDFYYPALDNVGFEPLPVERLDALVPITAQTKQDQGWRLSFGANVGGNTYDQQRALGYIPAWSSTVHPVSRIYGALQGELKYWVNAREYASPSLYPGLSEAIDKNIENAILTGEASKHYYPSQVEALRTFFDNIREEPDYVPYIQNHLYNSVFADTAPNAKNFVLTLSLDMTINREKAKTNIPTTI